MSDTSEWRLEMEDKEKRIQAEAKVIPERIELLGKAYARSQRKPLLTRTGWLLEVEDQAKRIQAAVKEEIKQVQERLCDARSVDYTEDECWKVIWETHD